MRNTKKALVWITNILQKYDIPFQITGGLAVRIYGSARKLADIDIDIPEEGFKKIQDDVSPYIIFGPGKYKNKHWDLFLMTLNYNGQEIDLCGTNKTKMYNMKDKVWVKQNIDLSKSTHTNIYGLYLPIVSRDELLAYKKIVARDVDLLDSKFLEK